MATGYTCKLMEEGQTFPEFVLRCARAFGPLASMRDEDMDAPIPEDLGANANKNDYYTEALATAKRKLKGLEAMDAAAQLSYGRMKKEAALNDSRAAAEKNRLEDERLANMKEQIEAWTPPTSEHVELKKFMLEQITVSFHGSEYYEREIKRLEEKEPQTFYDDYLESALRDVEYYGEQSEKRPGNYDFANKWVKDLRESLKS